MITVDFLMKHFRLVPLPEEGGYFAETYRSARCLAVSECPNSWRITHPNSVLTKIRAANAMVSEKLTYRNHPKIPASITKRVQ